ncbi:hypothetical protein SAMN05216357_112138 [Porphyromonadaceae bacterium KH3CP3RA]|nr:hypothetical protein SAMN05216357_112138 [Porphyromonadaceae bacterium KH3CP3RA]
MCEYNVQIYSVLVDDGSGLAEDVNRMAENGCSTIEKEYFNSL